MTGWKLKTRTLSAGRIPLLMGIVNVTPDSFSDGGRYRAAGDAVRHALKLVDDGADLLDVGGESTRPYSESVSLQEELDRVLPVVERIVRESAVPVSIDTSKAAVAQIALAAGAEVINDVTGLAGDPDMIRVAVENACGVCAMHMQGTPQTMQDSPSYSDVTAEIRDWLVQRRRELIESGIDSRNICLDPGIGFGKTHEHNLQLLAQIDQFLQLGAPILVGHSRKGLIGKISGDPTAERVAGTLAVSLHLARAGVHVLRVHDVRETRQGLLMQAAILERMAMEK